MFGLQAEFRRRRHHDYATKRKYVEELLSWLHLRMLYTLGSLFSIGGVTTIGCRGTPSGF